MKFWISNLYHALETSVDIMIYGAGMYAKEVYPVLKKMGLKQKIKAFVVTDMDKSPTEIDGISVCSIDELNVCNTKNITMLIAVSDRYYLEIVKTIQKYKFRELLLLKPFILTEQELVQSTDEHFLEYIQESYLWNQVNCIQEFNQEKVKHNEWIQQRKIQDENNKNIVFIIGNFGPRYINIIGSLVRKGYNVKILEYGNARADYIKNALISEYAIECINCSDLIEVSFYVLQEKPFVYYIEPVWGDCSLPQIMIKHKKILGKIVLSLYDVLNDAYICASEYQKNIERYSLENADGVVWRWFSKDFLENKKGFAYTGKSIQFLDYCGKDRIRKETSSTDKLKLCMVVGNIEFLLRANFDENETYIDLAKIEHILEKIGNQDNCIFHLFVGRCSIKDKEVCDALEKKYHNVKFFNTLQHNELIQKVSEYDYGCLIYNDNALPSDRGIMTYSNYGSGYYNCVTNKLFDYISAGIPFITTGPYKLCQFFEQYGVVVKMNVSDLDINYLMKHAAYYKEKAQKARVELYVDNHIQKLIDFLHTL
ncbi:MAG: hypothetical protein HFJ07_19655 [Lachnospiraceae bacterium]|nr:hypothetical protein [Lachnospiraceae bacterium]